MPRLHSIFRDLGRIAVAFSASLAIGFAVNFFRPAPLTIPYCEREVRLMASLSGVGGEPRATTLREAEEAWRKGSAVFIDARASDFFDEGHIPGAIHVAVSDISAGRPAGLPKNMGAALVVYCSGGGCEDSRLVAKALAAAGYTNVSVFPGGWDEWTAGGLPE
jgi:rhodanese-related sulfurtransferase